MIDKPTLNSEIMAYDEEQTKAINRIKESVVNNWYVIEVGKFVICSRTTPSMTPSNGIIEINLPFTFTSEQYLATATPFWNSTNDVKIVAINGTKNVARFNVTRATTNAPLTTAQALKIIVMGVVV